MGKKKKIEGIEIPQGETSQTIIFFDDENEDLSALPRQQRRLRERLKRKRDEQEAKKFLRAQKLKS